MDKHFKLRVVQTQKESLFTIFAKNKNEAIINFMNHHYNKDNGFVCIFDIKEVK